MKSCMSCKGSLTAKRENYRYKECGLSNVVLVNVEVRRCGSCGETEVVIPRIAQLHRVMAMGVSKKAARLTPEEIRFLRKYLGWSGADFAKIFGVTSEAVSRWEHGVNQMSLPIERFLRVCALGLEPIKDYSIVRNFATKTAKPNSRPIRLTLEDDEWREAA